MEPFKKILFPVDLSEASRQVAPYVDLMVEKFDAESHLIHVVHLTDYYSSMEEPIPSVKGYETEISNWAEGKIQQFAKANMTRSPTAAKVVVGRPGDEIINYAETEEIDLIIMAHSQSRIGKLIFGSVARSVVKRASMATMVINPYRPAES